MPAFETRHRVAHSPRQMYDLVADIERYPEFLPMCTGLSVISREQGSDGAEHVVAQMRVGYGSISETFTTRVALQPGTLTIAVSYVDGPFKYLNNDWQFVAAPDGRCDIDFSINYAFKSMLLGAVVGGLFDQAFRKFTQAFEQRAHAVYGPAKGSTDNEEA